MTYAIVIAILSIPVVGLCALRQIAAQQPLPAKVSLRKGRAGHEE
jgi:hypothetical protein